MDDETLQLTPSESLLIRASTREALEVEATYGAGGSPPPKHLHPRQSEDFEVLEGSLRVRVEGAERTLAAGQKLHIPAGAAHQMWNPGGEEARVSWVTRPRGRTEEWFRAIDRVRREGRVGSNGMPGPLIFGVLLGEYGDVFRLAVAPAPLQGALVAALGAAGRLRGYGSLVAGAGPG